jgi:hypothetical protein
MVRRPSGGRAVLHAGGLTYALIWPDAPRQAQTGLTERPANGSLMASAALGLTLQFGDEFASVDDPTALHDPRRQTWWTRRASNASAVLSAGSTAACCNTERSCWTLPRSCGRASLLNPLLHPHPDQSQEMAWITISAMPCKPCGIS